MIELRKLKVFKIFLVITICFLSLMLLGGILQTFDMYNRFGWSYEIWIPNNPFYKKMEIFNLTTSISALGFISYLMVILLTCLYYIMKQGKEKGV